MAKDFEQITKWNPTLKIQFEQIHSYWKNYIISHQIIAELVGPYAKITKHILSFYVGSMREDKHTADRIWINSLAWKAASMATYADLTKPSPTDTIWLDLLKVPYE